MAKNYTVTLSILGSLDPSLLSAIQTAQAQVAQLGKLNGKAIAAAQKLQRLQGRQAELAAYRKLQREVNATAQARAQEMLTANRSLAQRSTEAQKLAALQTKQKELQAAQRQAKAAQIEQAASVKSARAALQAAQLQARAFKQAGNVEGFRAAQIQIAQLTSALKNQQAQARAAAQSLKEITAAVKSNRVETRTQSQIVGDFDKGLAASSKRAADLQAKLLTQQRQLAEARARLNSQGMTGTLAGHEMRLSAEIQRTTQALNAEIAALERRNQLTANFQSAQQGVANAYSNLQNAVSTAETIMSPLISAAKNAMTFEQAMSKVKALTQMRNLRSGNMTAVREEMAALEAQAKSLGATSEFTATEVAQAMGFYGMAGWDSKRIQAAMPMTIDLASIEGSHNIPRVADMISDIATAMGITAGETVKLGNGKVVDAISHFGDAWAYATTQANLGFEDLFQSMKYNAAPMRLAGFSMGEIFASQMMAANAGIKGSMAGTAFRAGAIRMLAPAKAGAKALQELGLSASEAQKSMAAAGAAMQTAGVSADMSAMERVVAIKKRYDELGKEGRTALVNDIFGKNAFTTWQQILEKNSLAQLQKMAGEIDSGSIEGWASQTADVMRDNTAIQVEYLKSAWDALSQSIGSAFLPAIASAAGGLSSMVGALNEWVKQNQTAVQWAGLLAAAISTIVVAGAGLALLASVGSYVASGLMLAANAVRGFVTILSAARAAVMGLGVVSAVAGALATAPFWALAAAIAAVIAVISFSARIIVDLTNFNFNLSANCLRQCFVCRFLLKTASVSSCNFCVLCT